MKSTALEYADDDQTRCTCPEVDVLARQGMEGLPTTPCELHRPEVAEAPPGRLADRLRAAFAFAAEDDQDGQHGHNDDDDDGQHGRTGPQPAAETLSDDQAAERLRTLLNDAEHAESATE
jgi:hypothetical protein